MVGSTEGMNPIGLKSGQVRTQNPTEYRCMYVCIYFIYNFTLGRGSARASPETPPRLNEILVKRSLHNSPIFNIILRNHHKKIAKDRIQLYL